MTDGLHQLAEERSLALHRLVVERLRGNPGLLERARERVAGWLRDGATSRTYAEAWAQMLELPLNELSERLVDPSERGRALRQASPFAGVIDARTRWRVWRETAGRLRQP